MHLPKLNFAIVKKHPVAFVGGLVAIFAVVFLLSNKGGGSSATAAPAGTDPATTAANTQLQLAGLQLTGQSNQFAFQLADDNLNNNSSLAALTLQLQASTAQATQQFNLGALQAQLDAALQGHISDNNLTLGVDNLQTQVNLSTIESNTQLGIAADQTGANIAIAGINAQTQQVLAASQADVLKTVAQYQAQTQLAGYNAQYGIASLYAGAQNNASNNSLLAGIFKGGFGLLGTLFG